MPLEITPDEAIEGAGQVLEMTGLSIIGDAIGADSPGSFQAMMASAMLVVSDMMNGNCDCDSCVRIRDIFGYAWPE